MGRRLLPAAALAGLLLAIPAVVLAHPLGNFTVNHYAGITVTPDEIELDVVIDMAEIPTFQERRRIDTDGDGDVTDAETAVAAPEACASLRDQLRLAVGSAPRALTSGATAITFPSGLGGLSTMRLECAFTATIAPLAAGTTIEFSDGSHGERIGWREIVVTGRGVVVDAGKLPSESLSRRLTEYPEDLISKPLDVRSATFTATPDPARGAAAGGGEPAVAGTGAGAVPGGVAAADLPAIFRSADLSPVVLLVSIVTALLLGAQHALTPGHGKTLMAAYLVGTRGRPLHAVGLGLAVSVSHTIGILVLAAVVVGAAGILPVDTVNRVTPVIAAVTIAAVGGWMLVSEIRRRLRGRRAATSDGHDRRHQHGHEHDHAAEHSHGGLRHSHLPPPGSTVGWRSLTALGLAGGLIPSTSALFILLVSLDIGRPALGFVLVVVFGLGMALVMTGVGLAIVFARERVDRLSGQPGFTRLGRLAPLGAGVVVLAFGLFLTAQALVGTRAL